MYTLSEGLRTAPCSRQSSFSHTLNLFYTLCLWCRLWIWPRYSLHWWDGLWWINASSLWPTNRGSTAVGSSWRAVWHCCYWRCRECKKVSRLWWATRSIQESIVQYKSFPKEKKAIDQYMSMLKVSCTFVIN